MGALVDGSLLLSCFTRVEDLEFFASVTFTDSFTFGTTVAVLVADFGLAPTAAGEGFFAGDFSGVAFFPGEDLILVSPPSPLTVGC